MTVGFAVTASTLFISSHLPLQVLHPVGSYISARSMYALKSEAETLLRPVYAPYMLPSRVPRLSIEFIGFPFVEVHLHSAPQRVPLWKQLSGLEIFVLPNTIQRQRGKRKGSSGFKLFVSFFPVSQPSLLSQTGLEEPAHLSSARKEIFRSASAVGTLRKHSNSCNRCVLFPQETTIHQTVHLSHLYPQARCLVPNALLMDILSEAADNGWRPPPCFLRIPHCAVMGRCIIFKNIK